MGGLDDEGKHFDPVEELVVEAGERQRLDDERCRRLDERKREQCFAAIGAHDPGRDHGRVRMIEPNRNASVEEWAELFVDPDDAL